MITAHFAIDEIEILRVVLCYGYLSTLFTDVDECEKMTLDAVDGAVDRYEIDWLYARLVWVDGSY